MDSDDNIVRCLIALTNRHKDSLDLLARNICRKRKPCSLNPKITTSTILRCLTDIFLSKWNRMKLEDIYDDATLIARIRELFPPLE